MHEDYSLAQELIESMSKSVIGKRPMVELVVTALIAQGHVLLEDIPGTGKTLMAKSLAKCFEGSFKRIQFTADMMPSDITGNTIYNMKSGEFEFIKGPIFAQIILADEINRATPRSQSSLLEVMEEKQVTVDGETHMMQTPFFVIATQNPLESYGTFPLPESQLDRFMLSFSMGYATFEDEMAILKMHRANTLKTQTHSLHHQLSSVLSAPELMKMSQSANAVEVSDEVEAYLLRLMTQTREGEHFAHGASTRASVAFFRAAQAYAFIQKRSFVTPDDIKYLAPFVLTHRVATHHPTTRAEKFALVQKMSEDCFKA